MNIYKNLVVIFLVLNISLTATSHANFDITGTQEYKEYESFAKGLKKDQNQRINNIISKSELEDGKNNQVKDIDNLLKTHAPNWRLLNTGSTLKQSTPIDSKIREETAPLIFISFSMPERLIKEYIKEANNYNGVLVLRGLINNSIKQTVQKLKEIENILPNKENQKSDLSIIIHPHLFKLYNVTQVPAMVLGEDNMKCILKYDECSPSYKYDKISGSITIKYALEQIRDKGDLKIRRIAKYLLEEAKDD